MGCMEFVVFFFGLSGRRFKKRKRGEKNKSENGSRVRWAYAGKIFHTEKKRPVGIIPEYEKEREFGKRGGGLVVNEIEH